MKSRYYIIAIWALLCLSCSKEFLNDCDQESPAFKKVNADFTASINKNTVVFKNSSLNAESYAWEFGDGTTSTVFDPNKTFAYRDTPYTVKLTASRCGGERQSVISKSVLIKCIPAAVTSLPGSKSFILSFNGEINFNIPQITVKSVEEYGFIYKPFITESDFTIGGKDVIKVPITKAPEGNTYKFKYEFSPTAKNFTYRAYIKSCNGFIYGSLVKL